MKNKQPEAKNDFILERIKGRPISKRKLFKKTVTTVVMALLFGLVACCTFFFLQPYVSSMVKEEKEIEPQRVTFPEDPREMEPEEMLAENMPVEESSEEADVPTLEEEQIQEILSEVTFDMKSYAQMYDSLAEYVGELRKSMVTVTAIDSNVDWFNNVQQKSNQTSGVVIFNNNRDLLILSYYDTVKAAESISVRFAGGIQAPAILKGYHKDTNLAVLAVSISDMGTEYWSDSVTIAPLGSSNMKNLETSPVVAMGMPMGTVDSVGYGMITSTTGSMYYTDANFKIFQTDILGSESATGVLFNLKGEVLGVITNHKPVKMDNVIMAYGITDLKKLLEKLSNEEPLAYLGLKGTLVTLEAHTGLNLPYGAYVQGVELNSPAMQAGLLVGDVITEVNGHGILSFADYASVLYTLTPGEKVTMKVHRFAQDEYKTMNLEMEADEVY